MAANASPNNTREGPVSQPDDPYARTPSALTVHEEYPTSTTPTPTKTIHDSHSAHQERRDPKKPPGGPLSSFAGFKYWVQDRDYHVWVMSLGFMLLFTSYPIQGLQTIRYPDTGAYILIVLYSAYFVTSMWATFFLDWWGLEFCLPWGPISYAVWIACMFSGSNAWNLAGAAFFGWGAGILWPAAGQLIAVVSTPHNRASNAGIYQCAFHLGVFTGGLILGGVQKAFTSWNAQYAFFLGLCFTSVICFVIHGFTFRRRYRRQGVAAPAKDATGSVETGQPHGHHRSASGQVLHRVQFEDGSVEYRPADKKDLKSEGIVVQDLALTGGRADANAKYTWATWKARFWQPLQMLWHPVFGPLGPAIFVTGGMTQGWFNASFNLIVNEVGDEWNGWIYAISESWAIAASIVFGLFYDRLRTNYVAARYRWVMYIYVVSYYGLCACALGAYYMSVNGVGDEPGQTSPTKFKAMLAFTGGLYNVQLLALEVSILTYLSTFLTYNADVAFSSKIGCEAAGYLLTFGLVNVVNPKWMIIILTIVSIPAMIIFLVFWHAPERPVATIFGEDEGTEKADVTHHEIRGQ
ncbi:uncharacterized protein EV422DRAFT_226686 [Fimicolochytrium jonesii]|uniref:uncharacterized protein n=1 Tax=Fimicolochytrium jonesii TaxID=1396493 RepID=UPI0022FE50C7|nr:uncharacterized protein EV422DRAFT_226686 [Fimicolochytrium jonesii]KAI8817486.1 hypothetical protein EV422DRAFT_226686 [Fimicolochytrium jonesii]